MDDRETPPSSAAPLPPWRTCLDFDRQDAGHYNDFVFTPVFELLDAAPVRVLELGCAGGAFGAEVKRRYPGATVVGVEAGRAAAERAVTRLDQVIHARLEALDLAAAGFKPGEFDTVIAADILEHLVNPWDLLVRLKPFLRERAQLVASIPNVRNIAVTSRLILDGRFDYAELGLLDVTHLRFFTLEGINRMFRETGYAVEDQRAIVLPALEQIYATYQGKGAAVLKLGRMTIADVTPQEMTELCAAQFVVRCRPA